jgi:hypothetical protein
VAGQIFELNEHESGGIITQNNRAMLRQTLGNHTDAETYYNAALTLAENSKVMREKSNNYQRMMANLAFMHQEKGDYQKAESIYLDILEQKRKQLKSKNADYAHILNNLAALYLLMNKNELARQNLKEALSVFEQKLGDEHPAYAHSLQNTGIYYRITGEYEQANVALNKCLALKKNIYGAQHPEYTETLEQQAIVQWLKGETLAAQDMYQKVLNAELEYIQNFMPAMSEAEKSRYWARNRQKFNRYYALLAQNDQVDQTILQTVLTYQGQTKALLMNVSDKIRSLILSSDDIQLLHLYHNWVDTKELLMQYYGLSKEELAEQKVNLDSLKRKSEDFERQLSENSDLFNTAIDDQKKIADATLLATELKSNEVLVEFIRIEPEATLNMNTASYLALVLHTNESIDHVNWKNGDDMDGKYYKYYLNAIINYIEDDISYGVYWKKLDEAIGSADRIYLVADGIYHQINPLTFKKPTSGYRIEDHKIVHLTNNKDLMKQGSDQKLNSALIIGNPAFGNSEITPLPGTANETRAINSTLKSNGCYTTLLQGGEATEAALRLYEDNNIIHVATHGFFIRDTGNKQAAAFGIQPEYMVDNPLLRSGLLMAGAGETMENYDPMMRNSATNGIVTSYEILNLNFPKTKMVVLSACETGLGEIRSGEGVYGLQRAFQVAGVPQLVMSLWKVDDNATEQLMKND